MLIRLMTLMFCGVITVSCAAIPKDSPPRVLGPAQRTEAVANTMSVPQPAPGMSPETLIRDFLKAAVDPTSRHAKAREFLTDTATQSWDDSPGGTILIDTIDVLVPEDKSEQETDRMRFQIRAVAVGHMEANGVVGRDHTAVDRRVEVTRVHGEWRISALDNGVLVDARQFQYRYQRRNLFYLDPTGSQLVPDPRWMACESAVLPEQLMQLLITGPRPTLVNAVRSSIPQHAALRVSVSHLPAVQGKKQKEGLIVDFKGFGERNHAEKQQLAAQVIWTLSSAGIAGPYFITLNGITLEDHHASGWTTNDVAAWDPLAEPEGTTMFAVHGGTLARVTDRGVSNVLGALGLVDSIFAAAVNAKEDLVAAVVRGHDGTVQLMVGPPDKTVNLGATAERSMTRPTWTPDGKTVWTVLDGSTVASVSVEVNGQLHPSEVDISQLGRSPQDGAITDLRLSADGVRAALVVGGRLIVMNVRRLEGGGFQVTDPQLLLTSVAEHPVHVTSIDWGTRDMLYIAQTLAGPPGLEPPILEVPIGSPFSVPVPSRNLTPPVATITASPKSVYVTDSRAVLQLWKSGEEELWKEIPMLHGTLSTLVLPK